MPDVFVVGENVKVGYKKGQAFARGVFVCAIRDHIPLKELPHTANKLQKILIFSKRLLLLGEKWNFE